MQKGPERVGYILDKNRTWAKRHFQTDAPSLEEYAEGYMRGGDVTKEIITCAREQCVQVVALWGMSDDNMVKRPPEQRQILYGVFHHFLLDLQDNWMNKPKNRDVRLVHMGRRDRLSEEAPGIITLLDEISADTRRRSGMVVAVALDYGGREEFRRAHALWQRAGCPGDVNEGWKDFLDLPRQGIPFRPFDLIVRTGQDAAEPLRTNEFLWPYLEETRLITHDCCLPDFTVDMMRNDFALFSSEHQNRGA